MYSSYPEERGTSVEAMELVASLACEDLRKRLSKLTTGMIEPQLADGEIVERVYKVIYHLCLPVLSSPVLVVSAIFHVSSFTDC